MLQCAALKRSALSVRTNKFGSNADHECERVKGDQKYDPPHSSLRGAGGGGSVGFLGGLEGN